MSTLHYHKVCTLLYFLTNLISIILCQLFTNIVDQAHMLCYFVSNLKKHGSTFFNSGTCQSALNYIHLCTNSSLSFNCIQVNYRKKNCQQFNIQMVSLCLVEPLMMSSIWLGESGPALMIQFTLLCIRVTNHTSLGHD